MLQLDFLGGFTQEQKNVGLNNDQYEFWDSNYNVLPTPPKAVNYSKVEKFFAELDYTKVSDYTGYWESIAPTSDSDVFCRWLFAFMSVHTSWKANIVGYAAIKDWWMWINKWDTLLELIEASRVGMHNNRLKFISEFAYDFWEDPNKYKKSPNETWSEFRNRLENITLGLGMAKTSFALEMCYPNQAKVTCLDTHMFQMYGLNQTKHAKKYTAIEEHWVCMSNMWNIPPYIARCMYWDYKQGYADSRYWSFVFEKTNE
jgi:hypothetical protein